ncbi:sporulation membrane protein YtrI [Tuberibacillus calidus]|uniref:sporulation membrane protein YtrI n=1 Tax=Tuberibacillus calidus TaxID=340097 RepID=UPI0003FDDC8D|nr:sporulation membrane protein YtrI [Tuberibacillus calidus]
MRIPPYYKYPAWQRFFAGCAVGAIIGFCFFILLYGMAQERQIDKIMEQETIIKDLKDNLEVLRESSEKENEELTKQLTIQEVKVFVDEGKFSLNHLVKLDLEQALASQLKILINKRIETVGDNDQLIFQAIEGHPFTVEDKTYTFKIKSLIIFSTVKITVLLTGVKEA